MTAASCRGMHWLLPEEIAPTKKRSLGLPFSEWANRHDGLKRSATDSLQSRAVASPPLRTLQPATACLAAKHRVRCTSGAAARAVSLLWSASSLSPRSTPMEIVIIYRSSKIFRTAAKALFSVLFITIQPASAQRVSEWNPTALEIQALPQYCQGQFRKELSNNPAYLPSGCGGYMNHFCPALVSLNRAANFAAPKAGRKYELQLAIDHLRYTKEHLNTPSCPLLKDIEVAELRARNLGLNLK